MRRLVVGFLALAFTLAPTAALAGSPHFVDDTVQFSSSGNTVTVSGKEAGLGDEPQRGVDGHGRVHQRRREPPERYEQGQRDDGWRLPGAERSSHVLAHWHGGLPA